MNCEELVSQKILDMKNEIENETAEKYGEYIQQKVQSIVNEGKMRVRNAFNRGFIEGRKGNPDKELSYSDGMKKAWDLARRLMMLSGDALDDLFDADSAFDIITAWTPEDVEKQLEELKSKDIASEGDEVVCIADSFNKFVVVSVAGGKYTGVSQDGDVFVNADPKYWRKTGKHVDKLFLNNSSKYKGTVHYTTDELPF